MVDQPPSDAIPYRKVFETLSAIAGILALPYAISLPLRDFKWVENQYSAGLMILIAIIASLILLAAVEAFQRWISVPGLEANGGRGYVAIALLAVCFTCFGFFAHYYIEPSQHVTLKKPTIIKFASIKSAKDLNYPELNAYRESLTRIEGRSYLMAETIPYAQPAAAHYFTVAPGEAIETGYAFLVPADDIDAIRVLKISRENGGRDLSVFVPEANAGDRVLLLFRMNSDVNPYPGEVQ